MKDILGVKKQKTVNLKIRSVKKNKKKKMIEKKSMQLKKVTYRRKRNWKNVTKKITVLVMNLQIPLEN